MVAVCRTKCRVRDQSILNRRPVGVTFGAVDLGQLLGATTPQERSQWCVAPAHKLPEGSGVYSNGAMRTSYRPLTRMQKRCASPLPCPVCP